MKRTKFTRYLLLAGYLVFISYFAFFSKIAKRNFVHVNRFNVTPFRTIGQYLRIRNVSSIIPFIVNVIGNIAVFIPFGIIMPLILSKRKRNNPIITIAIGAILLSLSIELIQYIMSVGVFDVDDLILNTIGALIGYYTYFFVKKMRG